MYQSVCPFLFFSTLHVKVFSENPRVHGSYSNIAGTLSVWGGFMEPTSNKQKQNTRIIFQPLLLKVVANGLKSTFVLDFVGSGVPPPKVI